MSATWLLLFLLLSRLLLLLLVLLQVLLLLMMSGEECVVAELCAPTAVLKVCAREHDRVGLWACIGGRYYERV